MDKHKCCRHIVEAYRIRPNGQNVCICYTSLHNLKLLILFISAKKDYSLPSLIGFEILFIKNSTKRHRIIPRNTTNSVEFEDLTVY
jgi:hypothetical protein